MSKLNHAMQPHQTKSELTQAKLGFRSDRNEMFGREEKAVNSEQTEDPENVKNSRNIRLSINGPSWI
ncbi:hypothetical protein M404DRAFT_1001493, partial [Pisolithus tinctorius Marx 270]